MTSAGPEIPFRAPRPARASRPIGAFRPVHTSRPAHPPLRARILWIGSLVLITWGISGLWPHYQVSHQPAQAVDPRPVVTSSTAHPSEAAIDSRPAYNVPSWQPKLITLPTISASGFIQKVGVDQTNHMAVPTNIHLAGWYTGGPLPGSPGLSVIDGHVTGHYANGIFYKLSKLKSRDIFTVEFGSGKRVTFTVRAVTQVPSAQADSRLLSPSPALKSELRLITCAGSFNASKGAYPDRLIVSAVPQ